MTRGVLLLTLSSVAAFGNACALSSGAYAALASTAGHWTGSGCTGGSYVAGNGDSADISAASLTIGSAESWTIGTSGAVGTNDVLTGTTGSLTISGTVTLRGNITSQQGTSVAIVINAGGTLQFDSTHSSAPTAIYYEYIASGWSRGIEFNGNSSACSFNGVAFAGSSCAVLTSVTTGGALGGDVNMEAGPATDSEVFGGSYAAISNLGSPSRNAVELSQPSASPTNNLTLDHFSVSNCGMFFAQAFVNVNIHNFAFIGGVNTQDQSEDFDFNDEASNSITRVITDGVFTSGLKVVSGGAWTTERLYLAQMLGGSASGTCNELIYPTSTNDISIPCSSINYLVMFRNSTATTGHFLDVPGTPAGTTQNISGMYCEFPDADSGGNQGKCLLTNGANPASPTQTNVSNLLLVPNKSNNGNAELVGGVGSSSTINDLLTVTHATVWAQGCSSLSTGASTCQLALVDESGPSNNTLNFEANIIYSDLPLGKSLVQDVSSPSTNTIKIADYNVAGSTIYATNSFCSLCTNQANGWTHKCVTAAGVTCPAGVHDLDTVHGGPIAPGFVNTSFRVATWDTLGPPANAVCTAWASGTVYTYVPGTPVCVSVSNPGVYGGLSINYILTATHVSGSSTQPDSGASWRNNWEYASLYDFRNEIVAGVKYSGNSPAKAFWTWAGTGWVPTAPAYRTTFPGDTNPVTNMGAFQMGPYPTVVAYNVQWGVASYNVIGTSRNRLPWQITAIQVVFSEPITSGDVNSLTATGIMTTGFSGLGTNTLTWTISPLSLGNFPTTLAGSGAHALADINGNALTGGAGFNQNLKILYGDFNDDGVVNSQDLTLVNAARAGPYNIFADMNGDGVVNAADVQMVRTQEGNSLP
jgi:hypothetical protein